MLTLMFRQIKYNEVAQKQETARQRGRGDGRQTWRRRRGVKKSKDEST